MSKALFFKYLSRSHTMIGLFVLFLFYISTFFGTLIFFIPYLKVWESPARHFNPQGYQYNLDVALETLLQENHFNAKSVDIIFPSFRDPLLKITTQTQNSFYINPLNNHAFKVAREENLVSVFFNELHTGAVIPVIGSWLMGIASVGILFLAIGGLWIYMVKRHKTPSSQANWRERWLSWHKISGLGVLPYALVFACTGTFLGLMLASSQPFAWSASKAEQTSMRTLVAPLIFPASNFPKGSESAAMLPLSELRQKAQEGYAQLDILSATLHHYGTNKAKITFRGFDRSNVAQTGRVNRLSITLDATNAALVEKRTLEDVHPMNRLLSVFYFLHFVPDETLAMRLILGVFGGIFAFCLVSGYMIWAEKKLKQAGWMADIINRVSIALMVGILPASAMVLFLNWILPYDLFDKEIWMRGAFFAVCSFWIFYSVFERSIIKLFRWMLFMGAFSLLGAVLFHGIRTHYFLWNSYAQEMWVPFFVDTVLLCVALILYLLSYAVERSSFLYRYERQGVFHGF